MAVYTVQSGDTLGRIATRFNTTVSELQRLNPQIANINEIFVGQRITVPDVGTPTPTQPPQTDSEAALRRRYQSTINAVLRNQGLSNADYSLRLVNGLLYILALPRTTFRRGTDVPIRLFKVNVTDDPIVLRYNTGQRFEIVVRRAADFVEVWRYSRGRNFIQRTGSVTVRPGQFAIYGYTWDQINNLGNLTNPGNFVLEFFNVAQGYRNEAIRITFTITAGVVPTPTPTPTPRPTPSPGQCTGENILRNPNFESWNNATSPRDWQATNIRRSTISFSGNYALEMGRIPGEVSILSQTIPVVGGSNNRVSFRVAEDVEGSLAGNFSFGVQVQFRNRAGTVVGVAPQGPYSPAIIEDERYELFTFTTGDVPGTAETAELVFTFNPRPTNQSRIRIDLAEFRCLSL